MKKEITHTLLFGSSFWLKSAPPLLVWRKVRDYFALRARAALRRHKERAGGANPRNGVSFCPHLPPPKKAPFGCPSVAEGEGFEPPDSCPSTVFKTAALNHSANLPLSFVYRFSSSSIVPILLPSADSTTEKSWLLFYRLYTLGEGLSIGLRSFQGRKVFYARSLKRHVDVRGALSLLDA